jgi:hypothetical protein
MQTDLTVSWIFLVKGLVCCFVPAVEESLCLLPPGSARGTVRLREKRFTVAHIRRSSAPRRQCSVVCAQGMFPF